MVIRSSSLSTVCIHFRRIFKALGIKKLTSLSLFLAREIVILSALAQLLFSVKSLGHHSRITFLGVKKQLPPGHLEGQASCETEGLHT